MGYEFDRGIAVTARTETPGTFDAELDAGWQVGAGINGGLLLALAANGLRERFDALEPGADHGDPLSISAYFLSAARSGPATVSTEVVRHGRTMSTGGVSVSQVDEHGGPVERVRALATFGDLASGGDLDVRTTATPPELPPPAECLGRESAPTGFAAEVPLLERFDLRHDPETIGWAAGRPSGRGLMRGWFRMADGREPDPLLLLLALDALPPVTFDLGLPGWAPTLELTAHVRARPAPGWLLLTHATRNFAGGLFEEDAEVWDSAGRLVAQSRQLARAPRQPAGR